MSVIRTLVTWPRSRCSLGLYEPRYGTLFNNGVGFPGMWFNVGTAYDLAGADGGALPSGFVSVQAANLGLKWEQTSEINVGVDFSLVDDKILWIIRLFHDAKQRTF